MKPMNLQDSFLNQIRKERAQVTVYLTNGYQSKGIIRGFDNFVIILEVDGKSQMIYKHAVSTVIPIKPIVFSVNDKADNENE